MKIKLGAHFPFIKELELYGVISDALEIKADAASFYISNPRTYTKTKIDREITRNAHKLAEKYEFDLNNIVVHAPIIGNIGNIEKDRLIFYKTVESYRKDLNLLDEAGLKYYCIHAGTSPDVEKGIASTAKGLNEIFAETKGQETVILLETMMNKGHNLGKTFEELRDIIELVEDKSRIGVCMDTCHVWDAGYDIKNDFEGVLEQFDEIIGLDYLKAMHINDSKFEIGFHKDRHEALGKGYIGEEAIRDIVFHDKIIDLPKIIQTPTGTNDFRRWKHEIVMLTGEDDE